MSYNPPFPAGQTTMSNSEPVVIASNQSPVSVAGTLGASIIGLPPVNVTNFPTNQNIAGSVVAFPVGNQSVSGTVNVNTINNPLPTGTNVLGSVAVLQGTNPWIVNTGNSSVAVAIVSGSISASFTPPVNQSVSGTVGASVIGHAPVVIVGGSIAASFTPPANQSVSGTVLVKQDSTWVASVFGNMSVIGTVPVTQATTPWVITGSVQGSFSPAANQSVSGTVGASIIGLVPVNIVQTVNQSVSGTVNINTINNPLPAGTNILGSVAVLQGTNPWVIAGNANSVISYIQNSIAAVIVGGSISASFTPPANQSVSGTVGTSIIGLPPFVLGGSTNASVITVGTAAPNQSVSGNIGASIIGQLPAGTAMLGSVAVYQGAVFNVAGSVVSIPASTTPGSVVAFQGGTPWAETIVGSVITVFQAPSIVGTYSEDATHTSSDKGLFMLHVRNDTLASVTSADIDYSPNAVGQAGEMVVANSPFIKWVQGTASMLGGIPLTGGSVAVIAPQGASIFTYITGLQVVNASANNVWLRFEGATNSTVGFTIAPANGGSNIVFPNALKTNANGAFTASVSGGGSSIYISAQGFISKT